MSPELQAPQRRLGVKLGWLGIRPRTLPLALIPVLVGCAMAWQAGAEPRLLIMLMTLACAALIQAGTNLFNDASDAERGNDGPDRRGPQRLTGSGLADAAAVKRSAWGLFAVALVLGVALVMVGGWAIVAIGSLGLLAGWAYSRGPLPLSYTPWGEVFVVGFFGLAAVFGSYVLQSGPHPFSTLLPGLAIGLPAAAVLLINNLRDREEDRRAGRRTLALVLGKRGSQILNLLFLLAPYPLLALSLGTDVMRACWLTLPLAMWLSVRAFRPLTDAGFNQQLQWTVLDHLLLGSLLVTGLLLVDSSAVAAS